MKSKKKLVVLSGAGISQESGIDTFRASDGLWEKHRIEDVATPEAFLRNPQLVMDFYNARRRKLKEVKPNKAHLFFSEIEKDFEVCIITQNVDDLHERAGSSKIIHLHGELKKARSVKDENYIFDFNEDMKVTDKAPNGDFIRPHIVWFGEAVPKMEEAIEQTKEADVFVVIGTSMQVYPAASLIDYLKPSCSLFVINLEKKLISLNKPIVYINEKATKGVEVLKEYIYKK